MTGRTVVVTGGNSGIGRETCVHLARMGASVVLCSRDAQRGDRAVADVRHRSGSDLVERGDLDLASVASIRAFTTDFERRHERLDVLVNNAGVVLDSRQETVDGFEATIGTNHIGHFLLTDLLRGALATGGGGRVVTVASLAHRWAFKPLTRDALDGTDFYEGFVQYGRSKLANILFTMELARRTAGTGVTATCCHPGLVRSGLGRDGDHMGWTVMYLAATPVLISPRRGAKPSVRLAAGRRYDGVSGRYVTRFGRGHPSRLARDPGHARWLWTTTETMLAALDATVPPANGPSPPVPPPTTGATGGG